MEDEEAIKKSPAHEVGMILDELSIEELEKRITLLEGEIVRLKSAIEAKNQSRGAADAVFKF